MTKFNWGLLLVYVFFLKSTFAQFPGNQFDPKDGNWKEISSLHQKTQVHGNRLLAFKNITYNKIYYFKEGHQNLHTLRSEIITQRIFQLLGLPVLETHLVSWNHKWWLAMEYKKNHHSLNEYSHSYLNDSIIQQTFLADLFVLNYDRHSDNFLVKNKKFYLIDHGASVGSKASGGFMGFPQKIDAFQVQVVIYGGRPNEEVPVNSFYTKLLDTRSLKKGKIIFYKKYLSNLLIMAKKIAQLSDKEIEDIVAFAYQDLDYPTAWSESVARQLTLQDICRHHNDYKNTYALKTTDIIVKEFNGDQQLYFTRSIISRRNWIKKFFNL